MDQWRNLGGPKGSNISTGNRLRSASSYGITRSVRCMNVAIPIVWTWMVRQYANANNKIHITYLRIVALQRNLSLTLFGQHIVTDTIVKGLKSHYASGSNSKKPLVLSFHGPPGTGKNFVADRVADFVYAAGVESKFVHKFMGRVAFPLEAKRHVYKVSATIIWILLF